ncbi:MAG: hypothetical protein AAB365_02585 [Patescibacteria group bacterium]
MIDLPTKKDIAHPHHRRAVGALVAAGIVFMMLIAAYALNPVDTQTPSADRSTATRQALVLQANPPALLTAGEVRMRQMTAESNNPMATLTPEQVRARQALIGGY